MFNAAELPWRPWAKTHYAAFAGRDIAFVLVLLQLMIMPVLIVENYSTPSASPSSAPPSPALTGR